MDDSGVPHESDDARRLADLGALLDVSRRLSASTDLGPLLRTIESCSLRVLDCERITIFLYDAGQDELYSRLATGVASASSSLRFPADRGIAGEALRSGAVLNIPDAYADPRFNPEVDRQTGFRTNNLLTAPLPGIDGSPVGVLQALNKRSGPFTVWDEELVVAFAAQAGVALQRQLLLDELAEKRRIQNDLAIARTIQQGLLPESAPVVPGFDLAGWNLPADQTGGDFFDFQELPGVGLALTLADVSGHGIGPALLAAECRALLRASLTWSPSLERVVPRVNELLAGDVRGGQFVTAFVGLLQPAEGRCAYLSAGQGPILFYRAADGAILDLPSVGLPLGILPGAVYPLPEPILLAPGDILWLCTDGFIEWPDAAGRRSGSEFLRTLLHRLHHLPAAELIQSAYRAVLDFAAGAPQQDDLTAVVLKRRERSTKE
jgi:sigma-B regulation protein RsbU (phosphoserine phosphatase)